MVKENINKKEDIKEVELKKKDDVVEVKREDLNKILSKIEKYEKDIKLLYQASDKNRLSKALTADGAVLVHKAKVSKWDGSDIYVIGWSDLLTNRSEVVLGKYIEDQTTMIFLEDGQQITVPYLEATRKMIQKDEGEIIGRETKVDDKGEKSELFKIQFPNGKTLVINSKFINRN